MNRCGNLLFALFAYATPLSSVTAAQPIPFAVTDTDFRSHNAAKAKLGMLLMFDKILSGNQNISCGTCHHALTDTGDGLSLPVGEAFPLIDGLPVKELGIGVGLGKNRNAGDIEERVPRNAPPVFNLGAHEFGVLFHDGRVRANPDFPSGCETPAGANLPAGLESVLACQAMFPVTAKTEMAGGPSENPIGAAAANGGLHSVWLQLAQRLQKIPEYVKLFKKTFKDIKNAEDITFVHAANAIAAFEGTAWRADNSPFDQYLRGDINAMSANALEGMELFYGGDSNGQACADCHSGKFQTDHQFHAIAMPQIGPGRHSNSGNNVDGREDFGREQVTADPGDTLKFRTPTRAQRCTYCALRSRWRVQFAPCSG